MNAGAHEMERKAAFAISDAAARLEKLMAGG
jgi:cell division protein ZapA